MDTRRSVQLAIDTPGPRVRVIRVARALDPLGAARLARMIDAQLQLARTGHCPMEHLVLDLGAVTGFDPDALGALHSVEFACGEAHVGLHLAGFSGRLVRLPIRVRQMLVRFSAYPTVEVALSTLDPGSTGDQAGGS